MCTEITEKVLHSLIRDVNGHYDTVSIWKWVTVFQLLTSEVGASRMQVWGTLHDFGLYPLHVQAVQGLQYTDCIACVEFCYWLLGKQQFNTKILFSTDGITNARNSLVWSLHNPHAPTEIFLQTFFGLHLMRCYQEPSYRTVCA
jgi:hypothetical protein